MDIINEDLERILLSALLGAVIGLEREWSGKSAGFRTLMLVSMGAALFTVVSYQMGMMGKETNSDITRIASNIATGIGFIGAGLIFKSEENIKGLTTAATVWTAAAIGMAAGIGNYSLAVGTTIVVLIILVVLHFMEKMLEKRLEIRKYTINYLFKPGDAFLNFDELFSGKGYRLLNTKIEKCDEEIIVSWEVRASQAKHDAAVDNILKNGRVTCLDY